MNDKTRRSTILREVSIETHELTVIRTNGKSLTAWCERCRKTVAAFAPAQIAAAFKFSAVQTNEFHRKSAVHKINENAFLLCGDSLAEVLTTKNERE